MSTTHAAGAVPQATSHENPWPGLAAFEEGDFHFFKGRDPEISAIARLVVREDLTFLWGFSGLGKTSLLRAGLFPRLREGDIFPVYVRLRYNANAPSLHQQCFSAIDEAAARWGYEPPSATNTGTLWEYVRRREHRFWSANDKLVTPLLVFDQFEEIFAVDRSGEVGQQIERFFTDLSGALTGCAPDSLVGDVDGDGECDYLFRPGVFKVLLSFREDFVAQVAKLKPLVTGIGHNYYRLESLTFEHAVKVVRDAGGHLIEHTDDASHSALCERIVNHVAGTHSAAARSTATVDPALLSLYSSQLNDKRRQHGREKIGPSLLEEGEASRIIPDFYEACMKEVGDGSRALIERRLVLHKSRTRDSIAEETLLQDGLQPAELEFLIHKRILRRDTTTRQPRIEFTHDVLVEPAVGAFARRELARERTEQEQRRLAEERQQREQLARELSAERDRAHLERRKMAVVALAVLTVIGAFTVWRAFRLSQEQTIRLLVQGSQSQLAQDPQLSAVFSSWAAGAADRHPSDIQALAASALNRSVRAAASGGVRFDTPAATIAVALSPSGSHAALVSEDRRALYILDLSAPAMPAHQIAASEDRRIVDVKFHPRDPELVVLNNDASVERLKLGSSPPERTILGGSSSSGSEESNPGAPTREGTQWAITPTGQLVVASLTLEVPKESLARVSSDAFVQPEVRHWLSIGSLADGVWSQQLSIPSTSASDVVILAADGERFAVVEDAKRVAVYDLGGRVVGRRSFVESEFVLSADGSYVLALPRVADGRFDAAERSVTVWRVGASDVSQLFLPGRDEVRSTSLSPDGGAVAVVQAPGIAQVWELPSLRPIFPVPVSAVGIRFSPSGRHVLTWDQANTAQLFRLDGVDRPVTFRGRQDKIIEVAFAADSDRIAALRASGLQLWTPNVESAIDTFIETKRSGLRVMSVAPNGEMLAVGGGGELLTLNLRDRSVQQTALNGTVTAVAYSADGQRLAIGIETSGGSDISKWASRVLVRGVGAEVAEQQMDTGVGRIHSMGFVGTSRIAYGIETSDFAGRVEIAEFATSEVILRKCVTSRLTGLSVDRSARRFGFGTFTPMYDVETNSSRFNFDIEDVPATARSEPLVTCDRPAVPAVTTDATSPPPPPASVAVPSAATAGPSGFQPTSSANVSPMTVMSGDLSRAVSSAASPDLNAWLALDRAQSAITLGQYVRAIAMTSDGRYFAAGGENGLIRVFDTVRLSDPVTLQSSGARVEAMTFNDSGDYLAAVDANGRVTTYELSITALLGKAATITKDRHPSDDECAFLGGSCQADPTKFRALVGRMLPFGGPR